MMDWVRREKERWCVNQTLRFEGIYSDLVLVILFPFWAQRSLNFFFV